ncbi:winged helix-turn-helix transcriptional regulator [bacterium]|nr:winged helix-turn-helix transcriptional regulator [bacterium]
MSCNNAEHFSESIFHDIIKTAICARIKGSQYFNKLNLGITFEQYIALDAISSTANICQRGLSKLILKDRSNTGRIVSILEEKGFVTRSIETKDNRLVKIISITEKGKEILRINNAIIRKDNEHTFDSIPQSDFDDLRRILKNIRKCIEKESTMQI